MNAVPGRRSLGSAWWLSLLLVLGGCQSAYFGAMEWLGYPKRELLVERLQIAQAAQQEARARFFATLEGYRAVVGPVEDESAPDLATRYQDFLDRFQDNQAAVLEAHRRINGVEALARSLFQDWEADLAEVADTQMQADGREQLQDTRRRYQRLIYTIHRAEARLDPVLALFNDQVLFLKHNLNSQAVATLADELTGLERQVAGLAAETDRALGMTAAFIQEQEASREKALAQVVRP